MNSHTIPFHLFASHFILSEMSATKPPFSLLLHRTARTFRELFFQSRNSQSENSSPDVAAQRSYQHLSSIQLKSMPARPSENTIFSDQYLNTSVQNLPIKEASSPFDLQKQPLDRSISKVENTPSVSNQQITTCENARQSKAIDIPEKDEGATEIKPSSQEEIIQATKSQKVVKVSKSLGIPCTDETDVSKKKQNKIHLKSKLRRLSPSHLASKNHQKRNRTATGSCEARERSKNASKRKSETSPHFAAGKFIPNPIPSYLRAKAISDARFIALNRQNSRRSTKTKATECCEQSSTLYQ